MISYEELTAWIDSSALHQQIQNVDVEGLFSNPWFLVPFLVFVCYSLWKKNFAELFFAGMGIGVWYLCGTEFMSGFVGSGGIDQSKILPVVAIGAVVGIVVVVFFFGRSD